MTATRRIAAILAADYARLIGEDEAGTAWASVAAFDYRDLRSGPGWPLHVDSCRLLRAKGGYSATAWPTDQTRPKRASPDFAKLHFTGTQISNPPAPFHASKFSSYRSSRSGMSAAASPAAGSARAKTA
jgi:hypothetical protein